MSSFALLVSAMLTGAPPATAEQVLAAHERRTSVIATATDARCGPEKESAEVVVVCGRRNDDTYRVPPSDVPTGAPGRGGLASFDAARGANSSCGIGANLCEEPVVDGPKLLDGVIKIVRALTDGE